MELKNDIVSTEMRINESLAAAFHGIATPVTLRIRAVLFLQRFYRGLGRLNQIDLSERNLREFHSKTQELKAGAVHMLPVCCKDIM